jgi:hypothetical protein
LTNRLTAAAMPLIVALAVYLRLANLDLAEFKRDEADVAIRALDLLAGRGLPLVGIGTSVPGLENGPLMIYLTAIPLALAHDAALASGFIGLLNVGALLASAKFAERVFGRLAALFAALAYAVGSWAVLFSRKLWPNEAMPLFSALLALALHEAVVAGRPRGVVLAGVWLGALVALHPSGILFVPFALVALAFRPSLLLSRAALLGAGAAALVASPLVIYEAGRGFAGVRAALGTSAGAGPANPGAVGEYLLALVGPGAWHALADVEPFVGRAWPHEPLSMALAALLGLGALVTVAQIARRANRGVGWRAPALALGWVGVPAVIAAVASSRMHIHYLIPLLPALFPLVGAGLALPVRLVRRPAAVALPVALLAWAVAVQLQHFGVFFDTVRVAGGQTRYGVPLLFQKTAVERALSYAGGRPIVLVSQAVPGGADDLPPIWRFLTPPSAELRFDDGGGFVQLGAGPMLYVVAPSADSGATDLLAARGTPAGLGVPMPGLERGYEYWRAAARPPRTGEPIARLENGLRLEEAQRPTTLEPRQREQVLTSWRVEGDPPSEELALFYHLVDDQGRGIGGRDRSGLETSLLADGDELLSWGAVPRPQLLPPGRYWLLVGAYRAGDPARPRLRVFAPDGQPLGDALRLGPIKAAPAASAAPTGSPLALFAEPIALQVCRIGPNEVELTWLATGRPSRDYTVFVHVVDAAGRIVAQSDRRPGYPTGIWDAGEQVADRHELSTAGGRVRIGLYDPTTGQRVPLEGGRDYVELSV